MKTRDGARAEALAKFNAALEAQRAVVLAEQNKVVDLEQQYEELLQRIDEYYQAVDDKVRIDEVVANPPDEVKEILDGEVKE